MRKHLVLPTLIALAIALTVTAPAMAAATGSVISSKPISSLRSFPAQTTVRRASLLKESVSENTKNEKWDDIGRLSVPKTESTEEKQQKQAQAEAKKAQEEAVRQEAERQAAAERQARQQAAQEAAVSRSETREDLTDNTTATIPATPALSASGSALASYATRFVGYPYVAGGNTPAGWDCSGFVQYVYAHFGISIPHPSYSQTLIGVSVPSIDQARPGDIIVNAGHSGIYIGNGLVINALNPAQGTQITSLAVYNGVYSIRRLI